MAVSTQQVNTLRGLLWEMYLYFCEFAFETAARMPSGTSVAGSACCRLNRNLVKISTVTFMQTRDGTVDADGLKNIA
jgi:hypothetical protein